MSEEKKQQPQILRETSRSESHEVSLPDIQKAIQKEVDSVLRFVPVKGKNLTQEELFGVSPELKKAHEEKANVHVISQEYMKATDTWNDQMRVDLAQFELGNLQSEIKSLEANAKAVGGAHGAEVAKRALQEKVNLLESFLRMNGAEAKTEAPAEMEPWQKGLVESEQESGADVPPPLPEDYLKEQDAKEAVDNLTTEFAPSKDIQGKVDNIVAKTEAPTQEDSHSLESGKVSQTVLEGVKKYDNQIKDNFLNNWAEGQVPQSADARQNPNEFVGRTAGNGPKNEGSPLEQLMEQGYSEADAKAMLLEDEKNTVGDAGKVATGTSSQRRGQVSTSGTGMSFGVPGTGAPSGPVRESVVGGPKLDAKNGSNVDWVRTLTEGKVSQEGLDSSVEAAKKAKKDAFNAAKFQYEALKKLREAFERDGKPIPPHVSDEVLAEKRARVDKAAEEAGEEYTEALGNMDGAKQKTDRIDVQATIGDFGNTYSGTSQSPINDRKLSSEAPAQTREFKGEDSWFGEEKSAPVTKQDSQSSAVPSGSMNRSPIGQMGGSGVNETRSGRGPLGDYSLSKDSGPLSDEQKAAAQKSLNETLMQSEEGQDINAPKEDATTEAKLDSLMNDFAEGKLSVEPGESSNPESPVATPSTPMAKQSTSRGVMGGTSSSGVQFGAPGMGGVGGAVESPSALKAPVSAENGAQTPEEKAAAQKALNNELLNNPENTKDIFSSPEMMQNTWSLLMEDGLTHAIAEMKSKFNVDVTEEDVKTLIAKGREAGTDEAKAREKALNDMVDKDPNIVSLQKAYEQSVSALNTARAGANAGEKARKQVDAERAFDALQNATTKLKNTLLSEDRLLKKDVLKAAVNAARTVKGS